VNTIQIERRAMNPDPTSADALWLDNWWNIEYYPTQYRLLESRGLAERVVQDLRLYEDPFFSHERSGGSDATGLSVHDDEVALAKMATRLRGGLEIDAVKSTQLVEISYVSLDPQFAARVANGYAEAYINWGIAERSGTAERGSAFLASEIDTLKQEIRDKEAELQALTLNAEAVVLDAEGASMVDEQLQSLNTSYSEAVRVRVAKEARYRELLEAPRESVANAQSSGMVQQLRREQLQLERDYETRLKTYKPEWPAMVELAATIDKGQQHLDSVIDEMFEKARQAAHAEYQAALRQEQSLQNEMARLRSQAFDQNSEAVEIANLRAEIETRRNALDQFYQAQSSTQAAARFQHTRESNIRIVDRALVPESPYQPNLEKDLTAGLGFGALLGTLFVFLLHYLDRTIKNAEQAERLLGLPVLAVIADVASGGRTSPYYYGAYARAKRRSARRGGAAVAEHDIELLPELHPRMPTSEAYRSLRAALLMSTASDLEVVSVTSSESGEGKSSTATNLAVVMAQLGKRVLLVDADLRRPRLHKIFSTSNRAGLVSCLTGGVDLRDATAPTGIEHLDVLPSGPIPPNPSELLASTRMEDLVGQMRRHWDFVVIDSPPVLAVSDPIHIGAVADGMIFCVAAHSTQKDHCLAARDRLRLAEVKVLGLVLNRYDATQKGYRERYYHYFHYYTSHDEASDSAA
jgi:capsular exopolysaccharide synthesis family protein